MGAWGQDFDLSRGSSIFSGYERSSVQALLSATEICVLIHFGEWLLTGIDAKPRQASEIKNRTGGRHNLDPLVGPLGPHMNCPMDPISPSSSLVALLLVAVGAYLVGSLSFAVIVSRVMGLDDPRAYGSGNPGATNVLRSGNKKAALLTLVLDAFKGWLPVWIVRQWGPAWGWGDEMVAVVGLAAFAGHVWPVYFRFRGGKGVATAAGVLLGVHPGLGGVVLLTWLIVAFVFKYSSLAALVAAVLAPIFQALMWGPGAITVALSLMAGVLIVRHQSNIKKLLAGTERKIGQ